MKSITARLKPAQLQFTSPMHVQPYGDREAGALADAAGTNWYITTRRVSVEYGATAGGTADILLGFGSMAPLSSSISLTDAFGAQVIMRHDAPDGTVRHARVAIGNSIVMVSDARDEYQPMPAGVYMYVENADEVYERALRAGATPLYLMADMPYGDRMGGVTDAFGNEWYISTHVKDMRR